MSDDDLPICCRCQRQCVQCAFQVAADPDEFACFYCATDDEIARLLSGPDSQVSLQERTDQ